MPLLNPSNRLDYNPDNIIQTSKKISSIALENMRNPVNDPDVATLSTVEASQQLIENMGKYNLLMGKLKDNFTLLLSVASTWIDALMASQGNAITIDSRATGSLSGSGVTSSKSRRKVAPAPSSSEGPRFGRLSVSDYSNRLVSNGADARSARSVNSTGFPSTFSNFRSVSSKGSTGSNTSSWLPPAYRTFLDSLSSSDDGEDTEDSDEEDDSSSTISSLTNGTRGGPGGGSGGGPFDIEGIVYNKRTNPEEKIIALLLLCTQLLREINILVVGRIKPALNNLNDKDLQDLIKGYKNLEQIPEVLNNPISRARRRGIESASIIDVLENNLDYSKEMFQVFDDERQLLMTNLLIVVNSYNQNEAIQPNFIPDEMIRGSGRSKGKKGGGRNYYGKVIDDSKDIPTIYSNFQNCPTKYLL